MSGRIFGHPEACREESLDKLTYPWVAMLINFGNQLTFNWRASDHASRHRHHPLRRAHLHLPHASRLRLWNAVQRDMSKRCMVHLSERFPFIRAPMYGSTVSGAPHIACSPPPDAAQIRRAEPRNSGCRWNVLDSGASASVPSGSLNEMRSISMMHCAWAHRVSKIGTSEPHVCIDTWCTYSQFNSKRAHRCAQASACHGTVQSLHRSCVDCPHLLTMLRRTSPTSFGQRVYCPM